MVLNISTTSFNKNILYWGGVRGWGGWHGSILKVPQALSINADSSETEGAVLCNMCIFTWFRFIILG
jgi:hypothetical protein